MIIKPTSLKFPSFVIHLKNLPAMNSLALSPCVELKNVVVTGLFDPAFKDIAVRKLPPSYHAFVTADRTLNPIDDKGLALQTLDGLFAGRIAIKESKLLPLHGAATAHIINSVLHRADIPELKAWSHIPVHITAFTQEESTHRPSGYFVTVTIHTIDLPEFRDAVFAYLESKFLLADHGGVLVQRIDTQPVRFTARKRAAFEGELGATNTTSDNSSDDTA
jgi:hypothetical protein